MNWRSPSVKFLCQSDADGPDPGISAISSAALLGQFPTQLMISAQNLAHTEQTPKQPRRVPWIIRVIDGNVSEVRRAQQAAQPRLQTGNAEIPAASWMLRITRRHAGGVPDATLDHVILPLAAVTAAAPTGAGRGVQATIGAPRLWAR